MRTIATYTTALLEVNRDTYDDIRTRLEQAGYNRANEDDGSIDMVGIAIIPPAVAKPKCETISVYPDENGFGVESQCGNDAAFRAHVARLAVCFECLRSTLAEGVLNADEIKAIERL